jgi:hypothetical protein
MAFESLQELIRHLSGPHNNLLLSKNLQWSATFNILCPETFSLGLKSQLQPHKKRPKSCTTHKTCDSFNLF